MVQKTLGQLLQYTILAESDNQNDPIVDLCRASLDGHFRFIQGII